MFPHLHVQDPQPYRYPSNTGDRTKRFHLHSQIIPVRSQVSATFYVCHAILFPWELSRLLGTAASSGSCSFRAPLPPQLRCLGPPMAKLHQVLWSPFRAKAELCLLQINGECPSFSFNIASLEFSLSKTNIFYFCCKKI